MIGLMTSTTGSLFRGDGSLALDPAHAIAQLCQADRTLARLIDAVGPFTMQLKQRAGVFHALAEAIVYQQLSTKAAATIHGRLVALFPGEGLTPWGVLQASDEALRAAGLSRAKMLAIQDLARRSAAGELPTEEAIAALDNEAIIEQLTRVRGVGRWTAEMFLMFRLGRPDVLPVGDYGIRKGYAIAFRKRELPTPAALEKHGKKWAPYRTVASWYLWRALDLEVK
jgi:3-methyladenine DNA glycosylase/8-oxoguanine DNA glycosylase